MYIYGKSLIGTTQIIILYAGTYASSCFKFPACCVPEFIYNYEYVYVTGWMDLSCMCMVGCL